METPTAQRTLVKSPPELWAEISDAETLGRRLEAFGEIRITRAEPENTVAWEGDRARGTVSLEPSGWGTKVTLTAEIHAAAAVAAPVEPAPEPVAVAVAEPEPESVVTPEPEPVAVAEPVAEPAPARKRSWLDRFLRRPAPAPAPAPEPVAEEPAAIAVPQPESAPEPTPEPVAALAPEPVAPAPEPPAELDAEAILGQALDALGSAHHRPFSR